MTSNYLDDDLRVPLIAPQNAEPHAGDAAPSQPTQEVAKQQASELGQQAGSAGQHVASVAKDQTMQVAGEAGQQAKDLLAQARSEFATQAGDQHQKLAATVRSLGEELHAMSQHSDQQGMASQAARQAAVRTHGVASWLESREPGDLVDELKSFARDRPGLFLALAAGVGLAAGRLTRGIRDESNPDLSASARPAVTDHSAAYTGSTPEYVPNFAPPATYADPLPNADPVPNAATGYGNTDYGNTTYGDTSFTSTNAANSEQFGVDPVRPYSSSQGPLASQTFQEDHR